MCIEYLEEPECYWRVLFFESLVRLIDYYVVLRRSKLKRFSLSLNDSVAKVSLQANREHCALHRQDLLLSTQPELPVLWNGEPQSHLIRMVG